MNYFAATPNCQFYDIISLYFSDVVSKTFLSSSKSCCCLFLVFYSCTSARWALLKCFRDIVPRNSFYAWQTLVYNPVYIYQRTGEEYALSLKQIENRLVAVGYSGKRK